MYKKLLTLILVAVSSSVALAGLPRALFTDESLHRLLSISEAFQTSGVIYTWSPRMNLSLAGVKELQSICADLKVDLIILLDPNISDEEADSVRKPFDEAMIPSYRLYSNYLKDLGLLIHYPGLVIYENGKIIGTFRPGYDEPGRIKDYLLRRL